MHLILIRAKFVRPVCLFRSWQHAIAPAVGGVDTAGDTAVGRSPWLLRASTEATQFELI